MKVDTYSSDKMVHAVTLSQPLLITIHNFMNCLVFFDIFF